MMQITHETVQIRNEQILHKESKMHLMSRWKGDLQILERPSDAQIEVHRDIASQLCNGICGCL